ncbi:AAA family ATPase [Aneurinibacillus sp. REN35]|uniref:AAA family ATPase n=1 Tax=Aneurinibacillus sp. REN35 TaxID=3237286 RepID=UPI0035270165
MNRMLQFDEWTKAIENVYESMEEQPRSSEARAAELYTQLTHWRESIEEEKLRPWEALLYTCLGVLRWHNDDARRAGEWLAHALALDDSQQIAWEYSEKVALAQLAHLFDGVMLLPLRQVDPTEYRKGKTIELQQEVQRLLGDVYVLGQRYLIQGEQAAAKIDGQKDVFRQASANLEALPTLGRELEECALIYSRSINGLYAPEEFLVELNSAIQELDKYFERWNQLFSPYRRDTASELSALEKLDALIGMSGIKRRISDLYYFLLYLARRNEQGYTMRDDIGLHAILMGNPGTGKTTIARLLAEIYHELGLLPSSSVIEVDRSQLVGSYIGHTEQKVMDAVERAIGGVLFIDEAYSLKRSGSAENDFGQVAVDTLVAAITNGEYAGKFVVVLAGYPEEMRSFLLANPGLRSRFPESGHFVLPDFTMEELVAIGRLVARDNEFILTEGAIDALWERVEMEKVDATFGNARTVKNIILDAVTAKGQKLAKTKQLPQDEYTFLYAEDFVRSVPQTKSAHKMLHSLIGLQNIKDEISTLFAFLSIQQKRKEHGLPSLPVELHAVFSGNPGTGKTTVAHIYAAILKEVGILKRGHLITVGRADLVAEYVGQTAAKTKRKITEALGGVLFIDEAHALLPSGPNDYSLEAIDTLVEEVTKHRENLAIILAGYPGLMDELIESNPGLRSRFTKYLHFPDYSVEELVEVAKKYAEHMKYQLSAKAVEKLRESFAKQGGRRDGNARLARSIVDGAVQQQAKRLMESGQEAFTTDELMQLDEGDIHAVLHSRMESGM